MELKHAHMGSTTCVVCTPRLQRHEAWCDLPSPRAGTRAPKPCAVSQLRKPWAQCHGLMGHWTLAGSHPRCLRTTQGCNALCTKRDHPWAQCHGSLLCSLTWQWEPATRSSHGHLDMTWTHTSMWGRHTDAPDTWSVGWCMLPSSEGLHQRHVGRRPVIRGTLRGMRQLVRGTLLQLDEKGLRRWQLTSAAS